MSNNIEGPERTGVTRVVQRLGERPIRIKYLEPKDLQALGQERKDPVLLGSISFQNGK